MKRHIITSLLLALLGVMAVCGQQIARMERIDMPSKYFQHLRPVLIYTPANFDEETMTDYDVIYVFDAQWRSTFDFITVLAHYELQQFDENIRPYIVVGICSPHLPEIGYARNSDYTRSLSRKWDADCFAKTVISVTPRILKRFCAKN